MKALISKKRSRDERERSVLFSLIELYLKLGVPVGSNTLKESGSDKMSSATIRSYFAKLERKGYLRQQHSSGGRIPTLLGFQIYANHYLKFPSVNEEDRKEIQKRLGGENRQIGQYFQRASEVLSDLTHCAIFMMAPRLDQDFISDTKLLMLDQHRLLCALITDFGVIHTEILCLDKKFSNLSLKKLERFFGWKMKNVERPNLSPEEENQAARLYSELMLRHLVNNAFFSKNEIYRTGFSKLLINSDLHEPSTLADALATLENKELLLSLLEECFKLGSLTCWVGGRLHSCSAIATPYKIHQNVIGSIALLGPNRIPYRRLFGILHSAAETISDSLTKSIYKFRITFRQPGGASPEYFLLPENKT